ncbi:MAG: transcriptional regulator PpsR [Betaproteobacteria bacterium]
MGHADGSRGKLAALDAEASAALVEAASDIALVLNADGVISSVSMGTDDWPARDIQHWNGQPWAQVVTSESRPKVEELLREAGSGRRTSRWRHINHIDASGRDIPILFSLIRVGDSGQMVAVGRDLRVVASLQARLMEAQQRMETDYLRLRRIESQHRQLLDVIRDPILIVHPDEHTIAEANRAASLYFGLDRESLAARTIDSFLGPKATAAFRVTVEQVIGSGRPAELTLKFGHDRKPAHLFISSLRQEEDTMVLLRLEPESRLAFTGEDASLLEAIRQFSDGMVLTDAKGLVQSANPAFVEMIQMAHAGQIIGEPLNRWLGRSNTDLAVLINSLAQGGTIRLFATRLVGSSGIPVPVEISGVAVATESDPYLAFIVRDTGRRLGTQDEPTAVTRSSSDLAGLVGRMPLKDIVGETVDLIERLCIEAALKITRNNRASAADMLGLSRQSLYVKLRRYGIEGPDPDEPGA